MANIEIYTTTYCPYCTKAKMLLDNKGAQYKEIDVTGDDDARIKLVEKAEGRKTVPQIFINDKSYGGFDDIKKLNDAGELDAILNG